MNRKIEGQGNGAIAEAFADARAALAEARESHTGSWWNASVLRKRESLIAALSEAVRSGVQHVELVDVLRGYDLNDLGGNQPYDSAEEEAEYKKQNEEAISTVRPLLEALVQAGMTISGLDTYDVSEKDIADVLERHPVKEGITRNISVQADTLFELLDLEKIGKATDSALVTGVEEMRRIALIEIERQLCDLGVVVAWKLPEALQEIDVLAELLADAKELRRLKEELNRDYSAEDLQRWEHRLDVAEMTLTLLKDTPMYREVLRRARNLVNANIASLDAKHRERDVYAAGYSPRI